jgi:hypothetical protein
LPKTDKSRRTISLLGAVMDILGHSKMATTTDLYAHVPPAASRWAAAGLIDQSLRTKKQETAIP